MPDGKQEQRAYSKEIREAMMHAILGKTQEIVERDELGPEGKSQLQKAVILGLAALLGRLIKRLFGHSKKGKYNAYFMARLHVLLHSGYITDQRADEIVLNKIREEDPLFSALPHSWESH